MKAIMQLHECKPIINCALF
uniref:Uncharacterized protein n=1 Tax=Anguilla anguilla TaxID=7936 RepID=A0A0E9P5K4_ANGAN